MVKSPLEPSQASLCEAHPAPPSAALSSTDIHKHIVTTKHIDTQHLFNSIPLKQAQKRKRLSYKI
jgi:hypothetical protein